MAVRGCKVVGEPDIALVTVIHVSYSYEVYRILYRKYCIDNTQVLIS